MKVLLIWVLKCDSNSYYMPVTITPTILHPAIQGNDENDLRIVFFPAVDFVLIKMPLKKTNVHKYTKHDKCKAT
jgi:hypothetical protein